MSVFDSFRRFQEERRQPVDARERVVINILRNDKSSQSVDLQTMDDGSSVIVLDDNIRLHIFGSISVWDVDSGVLWKN